MNDRMTSRISSDQSGQPTYRTSDRIGVRSGFATGGLAISATTMPMLVSAPLTMATTMGMGVAIALAGASLKEAAVQICEAMHRRRNGGHAPGAHLHLATVIDEALAARMLQTGEVSTRTQRVRDAIRAMAAKPLDAYVDRTRKWEQDEERRRAMHETVVRCLDEMRNIPVTQSIGSMKLEGILRRMTGPLFALLEPQPTTTAQVRTQTSPQPTPKPAAVQVERASKRPTPPDRGGPGHGESSRAVRSPEPVRKPPLAVMLEDMGKVTGGAQTAAEITRLKNVVAEAGTRYLTRERRYEISTLVNVHMVDMAATYVRAAAIAQGRDLDELRRRTHEGLLPVLGTLRDAYSTCLEQVTEEVEAKVRFMEKRHPLPENEL